MGINKLMDKEGNVLFDLTQDTVVENAVKKGFIFHDKHGNILIGKGVSDDVVVTPTFFDDNVIFYDYDNYSFAYIYTNEEIANLSALPDGVSHDKLTFIGWNYSLEDIKNGVTHQVFPMYKTTDGKLYIGIETSSDSQALTLNTSLSKYTVNWGDGTETTGTSSHTYATKGTYEITIDSNKTNFTFVKPFSSSNSVIRYIYLSEYVNVLGSQCLSSVNNYFFITMPNVLTSIGNDAFYNCYGLSSIVIPSSVTSIGNDAFYNCYGLSSIVIPSSVTSIGNYAFYSCYGLSSIVIPSSVTSIGSYAFHSCCGLSSIVIPSSVTSIGSYAFHSCCGLSSIVIPSSVTSIGNYAFYSCYGLSSIVIPSSVTSIGNYAFYSCYGLSSIVIPSSVTSIGNDAFYSCYGLSSIVIPSSVTSIGNDAFYGCSPMYYDLTTHSNPPQIANVASVGFENSTSVTRRTGQQYFIKKGTKEKYASATNWATIYAYNPSMFVEVEI